MDVLVCAFDYSIRMGFMKNRLVCVVNNYNYSRYLRPCLESALRQPFDRIVVVDDGSTDDSESIIREYAGAHGHIVPVIKPNGGQLSCFNAAVQYVDEGDWVFFLDADDLFPGDFVDEFLREAARERSDFYFCEAVKFVDGEASLAAARLSDALPVVVPLSSALTLATQRWIGSPTSALVVTGALFRQILPYPFVSDWRVRADDVLVFAASILGAKKVYLRSLCIGYRQHGANLYAGNDKWNSPAEQALRKFRLERLFRLFCARAGVLRYPGYTALTVELELLDEEASRFLRLNRKKLVRRALRNKIKHSLFGDLL